MEQTVETKEKKEEQYVKIDIVEQLVNEKAKELAKTLIGPRYRFIVKMVPSVEKYVKCEPGKVVVIHLMGYTLRDKDFWPTLKNAIKTAVPRLQRDADLEVDNTIYSKNEKDKKWSKETYTDKDEVLPLLPSWRLKVSYVVTMIVEDRLTKESVSVSNVNYSETDKFMLDRARIDLSRKVMKIETDIQGEE
jgi:hypothetical protein